MDKIVHKHKGEFQYKDANELQIGEMTVQDLIDAQAEISVEFMNLSQEMKALRTAYEHLIASLQDKVIFREGDTIIGQIDGELKRVKIDRVFDNKDVNLRFYKVKDGKLVEDKTKLMELI